ncbi:MAG: hypothetical protein ABH804_02500 [archaeon]
MPVQDASQIKEKIIQTINIKGPSLPVHLASACGQSILFTSAFLSELFSEKKIKISNLRVGSSPIYFLPGQEPMLENFSQYLKSREKEAYLLLKGKKSLKDEEQEPAIRVALRAIRDFAIPFDRSGEIYWRYFTASEEEIQGEKPKIKEEEKGKISKELEIFEKPKQKKKQVKKKSSAKNEKFFERVKEFLSKKEIQILNIENFRKDELLLRAKENEEEKLFIIYNKKRITESDIVSAYKKALEFNLKYVVLSFGEPAKKLDNFIKAAKNLSKIEKIE